MTIHTSRIYPKKPYITYERSGLNVYVALTVFNFVDVFYIHTIHTRSLSGIHSYIVIYATTSLHVLIHNGCGSFANL